MAMTVSTTATTKANDPPTTTKPTPPPTSPPLDQCIYKLEKLLSSSAKLSNPAKTVRRWLTSTSILLTDRPTIPDIVSCAVRVLPASSRALTIFAASNEQKMEMSGNAISVATYECELWLISLLSKAQRSSEVALRGLLLAEEYLNDKRKPSSSSLFPLVARLHRFEALFGTQNNIQNNRVNRSSHWHAHYRAAVVRKDLDTAAVLSNLILCHLIQTKRMEEAAKFLAAANDGSFKSNGGGNEGSNAQYLRHLYYSGIISALRLDYYNANKQFVRCEFSLSSSYSTSQQNKGLLGFRANLLRALVVTQLLLGEIPKRSLFCSTNENSAGSKESTASNSSPRTMNIIGEPYLHLVQAVRRGFYSDFQTCLQTHSSTFKQHGLLTLITRLKQVVLKAGLRRLVQSYTRISLKDVGSRLGLETSMDHKEIVFVVSKCIHDGVVDATLEYSNDGSYGDVVLVSNTTSNVYATGMEPTEEYHRRIAFCLNLHNDCVRALRFPPDEYKLKLNELSSRRNKRKNKLKKSRKKQQKDEDLETNREEEDETDEGEDDESMFGDVDDDDF